MKSSVQIEQVGHAWVQDLGRPGYCRVGVAANGASDARSAAVANILVGNAPSAALLEITGSGLTLVTEGRTLLAATGAAERLWVDGALQPTWEAVVVEGGSRVTLEAPSRGWRSYIAFNGQITAERVFGSVSPDPLMGVGRVLAAGDRLHLESNFENVEQPYLRHPVFRFGASRNRLTHNLEVLVTPGPDAHEFSSGGLGAPRSFEVSPASDHVGIRLRGDTPPRSVASEILSRGVPVGAVEVPPTGGLLVLLRGRLVTAGYPVIAVATTASVDGLGQARPGDSITFRQCTVEEAVGELRRRDQELAALATRVGAAFAAVGLGHAVDAQHPSRRSRAMTGSA